MSGRNTAVVINLGSGRSVRGSPEPLVRALRERSYTDQSICQRERRPYIGCRDARAFVESAAR
jgi:hypothetical protein